MRTLARGEGPLCFLLSRNLEQDLSSNAFEALAACASARLRSRGNLSGHDAYSATYVPRVGTVSTMPCSRRYAIVRRTVDRPSSNSSMKSDSLGSRDPFGYSPDLIRSVMICASCRYGGSFAVGSIPGMISTLTVSAEGQTYRNKPSQLGLNWGS